MVQDHLPATNVALEAVYDIHGINDATMPISVLRPMTNIV